MKSLGCGFALVSVLVSSLGVADTLPKALTDAQKQTLMDVLKAQANWNQLFSHELKKRGVSTGTLSSFVLQDGAGADPAPIYKPIDDNCQIKVVAPDQKGQLTTPDGQKSIGKFSVDIEGDKCPVKALVNLDGVQGTDGFDAKLTMTGIALSDELKNGMDIDQSTLVMSFKVKQEKKGDPSDKNAPMVTTISLNGDGDMHSQKHGQVKNGAGFDGVISMTPPPGPNQMPGLDMTMGETMQYGFKDFSAKLHSTIHMAGLFGPADEHYFINDETVTRDVYGQFRSLIQLPVDDQKQNQGPTVSLSCQIDVYEAAKMSLAELQKAVQAHQPAMAMPLLNQSACGQDGSWSVMNGPDFLTANLAFTQESVELTMNLNQKDQRKLAFLPDESSDRADQLGTFTYRMKCDPVPSCQ